MAIGDAAKAAGYPIVPDTGEEGRVRWGARELNRTRDMVAEVKNDVPASKPEFRVAAGITVGTGDPPETVDVVDGDIYFKVI